MLFSSSLAHRAGHGEGGGRQAAAGGRGQARALAYEERTHLDRHQCQRDAGQRLLNYFDFFKVEYCTGTKMPRLGVNLIEYYIVCFLPLSEPPVPLRVEGGKESCGAFPMISNMARPRGGRHKPKKWLIISPRRERQATGCAGSRSLSP